MTRVYILTIFPNFFSGIFSTGLLAKAIEKNLIEIKIVNIRDFSKDKHKKVDDAPFGGGSGMIMKIEPIYNAVKSLKLSKESEIILFSPAGKLLEQKDFKELSIKEELVLICGRYEGIDFRVFEYIATKIFSIGNYVIQGGELAAAVFLEGILRMVPGFLGNPVSLAEESFEQDLLEYPQYTRPRKFLKWSVPEILFSGNHKEIKKWRDKKRFEITDKYR